MSEYSETLAQQNERLGARIAEVNTFLDALSDKAEKSRRSDWAVPAGISIEDYIRRMEPLREEVKRMLRYPPPGVPCDAQPEITEIGSDSDGTFYRVTMPLFEEGLTAYGLLIRPKQRRPEKRLAVAIHGGSNSPESAAGILGRNNHNDMGRKFARRGHVVWMPACYERASYETETHVHPILELRSRLVGTTLSAIDAYAIIRTTEVMLNVERIEPKEAIAAGLSYGGFRALEVAAISDLYAACISSCYFNDRRRLMTKYAGENLFLDWFFDNALGVATDVELCSLVCPRPLCIEVGIKDELFPIDGVPEIAEEVKARYELMGVGDRFVFDAFDGGHEFSGVKGFELLDRLHY